MSGAHFDTVVMVDWSGGNDTGPRPRKDAIWACIARGGRVEAPVYLRNRGAAEDWLSDLFAAEAAAGRRVLAGFDFPFGYPAGFAARLVGAPDPLALWDWFAARVQDAPGGNNRFDLAGEINGMFPGTGPFWANGLKRDIADLPRKDRRDGHGLPERRRCEAVAKGAFPCWQLAGAGAVGGQVIMGLPVLARLRRRFDAAAWPFEAWDTAPVVLVEVWPSLIADAVKAAMVEGEIKDAVQVQVLARALSALPPARLAALMDVDAAEEGWILGLGHEAELARAARPDPVPPALGNDCFALPPGVDWTSVDDALSQLRAGLHPVVASETLSSTEALGRVLAAAPVARRSNPPAPNSAVDGYGFAASAGAGTGPQVLPLVAGRAAAGAPFEGRVPEGHAIRILTGAILPEGVETVVLEEDVTADPDRIAFNGPVKPGANTRKAGEDVAGGATILAPGHRLRPQDLALLAALGVDRVAVHAPLRVGVLSTGDEIRPLGVAAGVGQIYDANRPMLLGLAARWGYAPVDLGHVPDDRAALRARLDAAAGEADVILTSGGASAGDEDHVSALLSEAGAMQTWRIAVKPGRPLALGLWQGVPVFGLPGNPVAAFVCSLVFARPAMGILSGEGWQVPRGFTVPAAFSKSKKPGRREYLRARLDENGHAEVFKSEGSGRISGLSWSEGLVEIEDGAREIAPGDPVRFLPYGAFGL